DPKGGRPSKVDSPRAVFLAVSEMRKERPDSTIAQICERLSRTKKLKGRDNPYHTQNPKTLEWNYHKFRASLLGRLELTDPKKLCARAMRGHRPCLTRRELKELEIDRAHEACKVGEGCKFREAAIAAATMMHQVWHQGALERDKLSNKVR